ncbi:hypothetical protein Nepgr_028872 [Nepenthes gracilis]|uniref:Zinc finger CCCH domain-containing protein 53-like n=1 Tax=Nepenthes gracilis TaxID=150966 RepID=A0AAD3Y4H0_NEPGR|nr:hypothetical protein Nepgr_028872 [Nepenthes gracilis]
MDVYEATQIVFSRIQKLDPEYASKIMGLLLIQDHGEKEMIRLAFGPENLLYSAVAKARQEFGISSNTPPTSSTPSSPSPFLGGSGNGNGNGNGNPLSLSRQNSALLLSGFISGGNGLKIPLSLSVSTLASPSSVSSPSCGASVFSDFHTSEELISPNSSLASYVNGISTSGVSFTSNSSINPATPPFYANGTGEQLDETQLQEKLFFLNDNSSQAFDPKIPDTYYPQPHLASNNIAGSGSEASLFPSNWDSRCDGSDSGGVMHRRCFSVSDISFDDPTYGSGWKPCLYFARGYCKNGASCRFVHGGSSDSDGLAAAQSKFEMDQCHEFVRSKTMQHQNLMTVSRLLAPENTLPFSANKGMNYLVQQQQIESQRAAAALIMGEDMLQSNRYRLDRNEFFVNGRGDSIGSRQIYLTFPADSTFREEDVSNYFRIYGPVQDVRIPYQQKRMFGFVTFAYPETVKTILAKGNPHFVCDARVLVKPYKEKGKVPDKYRKQQQQMDRREYSACNPVTAIDSRDPFDLKLGGRFTCDAQDDKLWRRKMEEQANLQLALELQSRKLMGLQLLDAKRKHHHRTFSTGSPIPSLAHSPNFCSQQPLITTDCSSPDEPTENCSSPGAISAPDAADQQLQWSVNGTKRDKEEDNNSKESHSHEDNNLPESQEHNLPDSPFASPTKGAHDYLTPFSSAARKDTWPASSSLMAASDLVPPTTTLEMASLKSCYFQLPRFTPGHGAIGM